MKCQSLLNQNKSQALALKEHREKNHQLKTDLQHYYSELGYTEFTLGKMGQVSDLKQKIGELSDSMHKLRATTKVTNKQVMQHHSAYVDGEQRHRHMKEIIRKRKLEQEG